MTTTLKALLEEVRRGPEVLTEASVIMYHGTSKRFLRRILKHGLQATPPERQKWAEHQASYGGAYLTPYLQVAERYAGDASRKDGSNTEVIVIMRIETRSTHVVPDEDTFIRVTDPFNHHIQQDLAKQFGWPSASPLDVLDRVKSGEVDLGRWARKWLDNLNEIAKASYGRSMELSESMIDKILRHHKQELVNLLKLIIVHKAAEYFSMSTSHSKEMLRPMLAELGVPEDPKVSRANFVRALDRFTSKIQQLASPKHELRSLIDVTYRGKNRILGILSRTIDFTGSKRIIHGTVHYGARNPETIAAMKDHSEIGDVATWKDGRGRVIWEK